MIVCVCDSVCMYACIKNNNGICMYVCIFIYFTYEQSEYLYMYILQTTYIYVLINAT